MKPSAGTIVHVRTGGTDATPVLVPATVTAVLEVSPEATIRSALCDLSMLDVDVSAVPYGIGVGQWRWPEPEPVLVEED